MIGGLVAQATTPPPEGGSLATYVTLAGTIVAILVSGLNAWSGRKSRRERAAGAAHVETQSGVLASGSVLEYRKEDRQGLLDERAYSKETRERAEAAEQALLEVRKEMIEMHRRSDDQMDILRDDLRQLRASIAACPGGPACPLQPVSGHDPDPET